MKRLLSIVCLAFAACQSTPPIDTGTKAPVQPASQTIAAAAGHVDAASSAVATTATHLQAAQDAPTLPAAKAEVSKAQASNAAATVAVQAAAQGIATAAPAAKAQEADAAKCHTDLDAVQSYDWLRVLLITAGSAAAALLALFTAVCLFTSLASSTILAAIPVIGSLISGARSALYLVMGELVVFIATCAYLAAHIVLAVDFGFFIAAGFAVYLLVRWAISSHLATKAAPVIATVEADLKPAGLWIEHQIAALWAWVVAKVESWLPAKKTATLPNAQAPAAPPAIAAPAVAIPAAELTPLPPTAALSEQPK